MNYEEESKIAFFKYESERLAFEIYLNHKYQRNINSRTVLQDILHSGWHLSDTEQKQMLTEAKKLADKKYFKNKV